MADLTHSIEEWRDIPGFDGYQASGEGRVRSLDRTIMVNRHPRRVKGQILSAALTNGYPRVKLGGKRNVYVHHLVCCAFYGPRSDGYEVAHFDGRRDNCRASNLRWATRSDNALDRTRHGTAPTRDTWAYAKVTTPNAKRIARMKASGTKAKDIAILFSITAHHARFIAKRFAEAEE